MQIIKFSTFQSSQIHVQLPPCLRSLDLIEQCPWGFPVYTHVCGGQDPYRIRKGEVAFSGEEGERDRDREIKSIWGKEKEHRKVKRNLKPVFSKNPGWRGLIRLSLSLSFLM